MCLRFSDGEQVEHLGQQLGHQDRYKQDRRNPADHHAVQLFAVEGRAVLCDFVRNDPGADHTQMKYANKIGAAFTLVLGDNELAQKSAKIKNMKTGEEKPISLDEKFMEDYLTISTMAEGITLG